jgi:hypothetical protein
MTEPCEACERQKAKILRLKGAIRIIRWTCAHYARYREPNYENDITAILTYAASQNGRWIPLSELHAKIGVPKRTLRRIFQYAKNHSIEPSHAAYNQVIPTAFESIAHYLKIDYIIRRKEYDISNLISWRYEISATKAIIDYERANPPENHPLPVRT